MAGTVLPIMAALFLMTASVCAQPVPGEMRVAAAADLQPVFPALAAAFEAETHIKLTVSYGSSATLAQQIQNGAPFDLFLAADYSFPEQVLAAGLADSAEPVAYARGALVLWARKDSPFQPLNGNTLFDPRLVNTPAKLAMANPDHAPYGRAALAALTTMKLAERLKPHIVLAENIAQTAQFTDSGNAQLGLISLTIANSSHYRDDGTFVRIAPEAYPPIRQCAVVMKASPHRDAAHAFLSWLTSAKTQEQLPKFGLEPAK